MKYIANPDEVDAWKIRGLVMVENPNPGITPTFNLTVGDDGAPPHVVVVTPSMTARMTPKIGDYYVVQDDGYVYLNPAHVFERKYRPAPEQAQYA